MATRFHIRRGDNVLVLAGKDRGKSGKVLQVVPSRQRAYVQGCNMVKKHMRPRPPEILGGIVEKEASIHISNLMLLCPKCGKPTRVARKRGADGRLLRYCKKCGEPVDR